MKNRHHLVILIILLSLPITLVTAAAGPGQQSQPPALVCGVDEWDYEVLYDFEADDGEFIANIPPGDWQWGAPTPPLQKPGFLKKPGF